MNSALSNSKVNQVNEETEPSRGAQLLTQASKGLGHEVVRILESDPDVFLVGDPVGDTALQVFARAGYVKAITQVTEFLLQHQHRKLLKTVIKQQNGLIQNEASSELSKVKSNVKSPLDNRVRSLCSGWYKCYGITSIRQQLNPAPNYDEDGDEGMLVTSICNSLVVDVEMQCIIENELDYEDGNTILAMLETNPSLIQRKNRMGNTVILHKAASSGNTDILSKLLTLVTAYWGRYDGQVRMTKLKELVIEKNRDGDTALHLAINGRNEGTARYLMRVVPETVYQVNRNGVSPLYLVLKYGYHELVKYGFHLMPTSAVVSEATVASLLAAKNGSLPHVAVKARNLMMLQMILARMPRLIDATDEKGWKPLSYAAYKGYLEEVSYLLNKFPESTLKFDSDGSLPIHKAVSGGHIDIIKVFILNYPQSLHAVDMKGRSVLHIAVRYAKADILAYLTRDTNSIRDIVGLRDHDGKTFLNLAMEMKRNQ